MKKAFAVIVCLVVVIMVLVFTKVNRPAATEVTEQPKDTQSTTQTPKDTTSSTTAMDTKTTKLPSGLEMTLVKEGQGEEAKSNDKVTVNYTGMLTNGTTFDSNVDPKFGHVSPFTFTLGVGQVIKGWDQGVLGMKVGEKRRLIIPADLGYGAAGAGASIPPNATLIFEVEVTGINK